MEARKCFVSASEFTGQKMLFSQNSTPWPYEQHRNFIMLTKVTANLMQQKTVLMQYVQSKCYACANYISPVEIDGNRLKPNISDNNQRLRALF